MENTDHERDHDVTQGENPGAQGDFGAGQGDSDDAQPDEETPVIVGDGQPRRDELGNEPV